MANYTIEEKVLLASGARTATQTLGPYVNRDAAGFVESIEVLLNLTAFTTAASLTLSVEELLPGTTGTWVQVLAATALTANGTKRLRVGPRFVPTANAAEGALVGGQWRVVVTHGNANSHTYSVTAKVVHT